MLRSFCLLTVATFLTYPAAWAAPGDALPVHPKTCEQQLAETTEQFVLLHRDYLATQAQLAVERVRLRVVEGQRQQGAPPAPPAPQEEP